MALLPKPDGYDMPLKSQSGRWKNFYRTAIKVAGNRFDAKCGFCLAKIDGRPDLLHKHVTGCKDWPKEEKLEYLRVATVENMQISQSKRPRANETTPNQPSQQPITSWASRPMTPDKSNKLHDLLLKSFVFGGIPFAFADNIFFNQFLKPLCSSYTIPSSQTLSGRILTEMFSKIVVKKLTSYSTFSDFTICFNGWTDVSGNSIYAFMLLKEEREDVIDILDLSEIRHTAVLLKDQLLSNLLMNGVVVENALACVTDRPTTMVKLRNDLRVAHPNVVSIRCCLHGFNLLAKDVAGFYEVVKVCKLNKKLVNYFTSSHIWRKELMKWQKEKNIPKFLDTFCETRWYSLSRVCLGVAAYEEGFRHCLELSRTPGFPQISNIDVRQVILNRHHFADNECVVDALKPIVDVIGKLEKRTSTLADVLDSFIMLYHNAKNAHYPIRGLKEHVLCAIGKRVKEFEDPIYFIAFFLHPGRKSMAISRHYTGETIVRAALDIAKAWNFERRDMVILFKELVSYKNGDPPFDDFKVTTNRSGRDIWEMFCGSSPILRRFAMKVFAIVPHSAPCERLFSILGIIKSKPRNRLAVEKLNMIAQIKSDLVNEMGTKKKNSDVIDDIVQGILMGDFDPVGGEDNDLELLDEELLVVEFGNTEMQNMEEFFDFDAFERDNMVHVPSESNEGENVGSTLQRDKEWSIDDIIEECR